MNPNVTMEIVLQNPDKPWDWNYGLSMNEFRKHNVLVKKDELERLERIYNRCKFVYCTNNLIIPDIVQS
jgi:hypothetical protein